MRASLVPVRKAPTPSLSQSRWQRDAPRAHGVRREAELLKNWKRHFYFQEGVRSVSYRLPGAGPGGGPWRRGAAGPQGGRRAGTAASPRASPLARRRSPGSRGPLPEEGAGGGPQEEGAGLLVALSEGAGEADGGGPQPGAAEGAAAGGAARGQPAAEDVGPAVPHPQDGGGLRHGGAPLRRPSSLWCGRAAL